MARIAISCSQGTYRASLSGSLTFRDLARLERSFGPALEWERPPLIVDLTAVKAMDRAARAFLHNLELRGVELVTTHEQQ